MGAVDRDPVLDVPDAAAWARWLAVEHARHGGVWLKLAKGGGARGLLTYSEALDEALCWGWIDGQKRSLDATHWLQRFTPRRARSGWSMVNIGRVEALEAAGRMREAGAREVAAAKDDGRWARAYPPQSKAEVPDDLAQALGAVEGASARFAALSASARFSVIYSVVTAVRPETRARRVAAAVAKLAGG